MRLALLLPLASALLLAGCDSGGDASELCFSSSGTAPSGSMTARVDGDGFRATCFQVETINGDLRVEGTVVRGSQLDRREEGEIRIEIKDSELGTSEIALSSLGSEAQYITPTGSRFEATSGSVTLETFSSDRATGTFFFSTDNGIEVTEGAFDVRF